MVEEKTSNTVKDQPAGLLSRWIKPDSTVKKALKYIVGFCILVIIVPVGIALFGDWLKADRIVLKGTAKGREDIHNALLQNFNDFGRLEVREDYSVYAYISKKNFMLIPFPDRDEAITRVGKAWCENEGVIIWYMPKVVLRDIETGEKLGCYRCLFKFVSKK